jgi:Holliday junction DNA helicase RuvA
MIGKLRGIIDSIEEDRCLIDVSGVFYLVFLSNKAAQTLKIQKGEVSLTIETVVKEGAIELYGFTNKIEKIWFLELTKVQGVGSKMAMKILGFFSIEDLVQALILGDVKAFTNISGVGPKLAQRLITELSGSPKKLGVEVSASYISDKILDSEIAKDAVSALENLGYKKIDILRIVSKITQNNLEITLENLITKSLKELSNAV